MQIILFLLLIIVLLISIYSLSQLKMKKELKITIIIVTIASITLAIYFEKGVSNKSKYKREIINSFQQNKELKCGKYRVNSNNFILNTGTLTFVAKSKELEGVIIKVEECEIIK